MAQTEKNHVTKMNFLNENAISPRLLVAWTHRALSKSLSGRILGLARWFRLCFEAVTIMLVLRWVHQHILPGVSATCRLWEKWKRVARPLPSEEAGRRPFSMHHLF